MSQRPTHQPPSSMGLNLPRPGKALIIVMVGLLAIWVVFAVLINWVGVGSGVLNLLLGSTDRILGWQVWRLFTAPLIHLTSGDGAVSHIVMTLLGLYFLAPSLEKKWGAKKLLLFLYGAAIAGFVTQMLVELALPADLQQRVTQPWFGFIGAVEAVAIAWAMSFRGRQVMLMFVLPVSSSVLVFFVVGMSVLRLFAGGYIPEGLFSPFGAMLFGYLVGGGDPSPARKLWLKWRMSRLKAESKKPKTSKGPSPSRRFEVIPGGKPSGKEKEQPRDKRWLN